MKTKNIFVILAVMLLSLVIVDAVLINQVYYDPVQETGSEAIELYNPESRSINITNYIIKTSSSDKDATLKGVIPPYGYFLVADSGWSEKRDNTSWTKADYEESITLGNKDSGVAILNNDKNNTLIDAVGWGITDIKSGISTSAVKEGKSLLRVSTTGNNSKDFLESSPKFRSKNSTLISSRSSLQNQDYSNISYFIKIKNSPPKGFLEITPGKNLKITARVSDPNGLKDIQELKIISKNLDINETFDDVSENNTINTDNKIGIHNISLKVKDSENEFSTSRIFSLNNLVSYNVYSENNLEAFPDNITETSVVLENTGTKSLSFYMKANSSVARIFYEYNNRTEQIINETLIASNVAQNTGIKVKLKFFTKNNLPKDNYKGMIQIIARVD